LLRIELTDKGQEMLKIRQGKQNVDAILSALTEKEKQQVYTNLGKVLSQLKKGYKNLVLVNPKKKPIPKEFYG